MRKIAYVLLTSLLFFGSASLAFANISTAPNAPTNPNPQFGFYCNPYLSSFTSGGYYTPTGGVCTYELTAQDMGTTSIFLGVYQGTVGSSTLLSFDFGPSFPQSILQTSPNDWTGSQDDDFFAVAVGYNDFNDLLHENAALTTGGTIPLPYDILSWKWGVAPGTTAPLTVTANDQTMQYGSPLLPSLTSTLSGFVNGDTVSSNDVTGSADCTTTATPTSAVGTYPITCTVGTLVSAEHYTFDTFTAGTLTITKAPLTVTAVDANATYGSFIQLLTGLLSGFVNGQTLATSDVTGSPNCTTVATSASPVGTYIITCTIGTLTSQNYSFGTFFPGLFTINKAPLTVTADTKAMVSGSAVPTLTSTLGGFVNGQTLGTSGVSGGAACSTSATNLSPAGNYPITCSAGTLASANYAFTTFVPGTLTVIPAPPADTQPPVIIITSPLKNGLYSKTDIVYLNATVTDASPIATTTYWFGTKKINNLQSLPLSTVTTPSIQSVSVSATDIHGNVATSTLKFFVVKNTNSCLLDIIAILVLITQDKTLPDKPTIQNLIADCSALLKGLHRYDDDGHHH